MYRVDDSSNVSSLPAPRPAGTQGYYSEGVPGQSQPTLLRADHMNAIQEELVGILTKAGITPVKGTNNQIVSALLNGTFSRIRATQNVGLYVNLSTGVDALGNGLSSATAFKTLGYAYSYLQNNYDLAGYQATINVTGTATIGTTNLTGPVLGQTSPITILGSGAGSCVLNSTTGTNIQVSYGAWVSIGAMLLETSGVTSSCLYATNGGTISLQNGLQFGSCTNAHIQIGAQSFVSQANVAYSISGGALYHVITQGNGAYVSYNGGTITVSAAVTFSSAFVAASLMGFATITSLTVTNPGNVSGPRYLVNYNAVLFTASGSATFFPGSTAGATSTGGQYG